VTSVAVVKWLLTQELALILRAEELPWSEVGEDEVLPPCAVTFVFKARFGLLMLTLSSLLLTDFIYVCREASAKCGSWMKELPLGQSQSINHEWL
jgi:hypothetical protein